MSKEPEEPGAMTPLDLPSYPAPGRPEQPMRQPPSAGPWILFGLGLVVVLAVAVPVGFAIYLLVLLS